nr:M3 family peptidase [Crocosphaera sp.]
MSNATVTNNPLLIGQGLPPFDKITPDHVIPAMTELLQELDAKLSHLEANVKPTWEGLVEPLTEIEEKFSWSWGVVGHLMGVKNSPELRNAYETVQPQVIQFINTLSQSQPIYSAYKSLQESDSWNSLENAQKRIVETAIREAELSGVALTGETREKFN